MQLTLKMISKFRYKHKFYYLMFYIYINQYIQIEKFKSLWA